MAGDLHHLLLDPDGAVSGLQLLVRAGNPAVPHKGLLGGPNQKEFEVHRQSQRQGSLLFLELVALRRESSKDEGGVPV